MRGEAGNCLPTATAHKQNVVCVEGAVEEVKGGDI